MKKIKSKHLWRRGATLLLAMLMLFTCVGSALPAFAEEATGNTAIVDSGDPVLADSSAGGDSTSDTDAELPDDNSQRPTLPSGEDISEETPPADESDGETVPPADSVSSEEPAAPDSGDSIPDESESEPAEQPGAGDADLPEDEQPDGEEPDPDEDEEISEDEPFEALVILDPENGATVQAEIGEEVTFKAPVNREDVAVAYQWQRFQKPAQGSAHTEALYDYAEGETTEYWYALDDMREAEALAMNPDMLWPGIEMYYATVAALGEIGVDGGDVSIAWRTPNFALEGYTISAAETEDGIEVYADKDDERHTARLNENGEWEFGEAEEKPATTGVWLNIEGANGPEYTFAVTERDYDASFRCEVIVLDEAYLEQCLAILEEQGIELTEEQRAAEQKLYSIVMSVESGEEEVLPENEAMTFSAARSMLRAAASGKPHLSADAQWIEGLDNTYEYITKDTYDRVSEWLANGQISKTQADRYWTRMLNSEKQATYANILDENGFPIGDESNYRLYQGFILTDGMLETNSEWYGKIVYFRVHGSGGTGTAINVPAYTELETDENGDYIEAASGTRYKRAITFLNAFVPDAKSMYQAFLNYTTSNGWLLEQDENGNPTGDTKDMHVQVYTVNCDSFNADPQRYISNLPCIFDTQTRNGVLKARVYTPEGREVTDYGVIRVNVDRNFWDNDMTIPLYLGNFTVEPVSDEQTYESAQAFFSATTTASEKPSLVGWQYRKDESSAWQAIPGDWDMSLDNEERITADGDHLLTTKLTLNNADPAWDGYEFRAVFSSPSFGQWNTYEYWLQGAVASGTETPGSVHKPVNRPNFTGELAVYLWPAYAQQGADQTTYAGAKATFSSYGYALDDGTAITAEWQYSTDAFDPYNGGAYLEWHNVKGSTEWGGLEAITVNAPQLEYRTGIDLALSDANPLASIETFHENAQFHGVQTFLTVDKVDIAQHGTHFRVKYTATSSHGTKMEWYSNIADEKSGAWTTDTGMFGGDVSQVIPNNSNILNVKLPELEIVTTPSALCGGAPYIDTMTPDEYGQMLLLPGTAATVANGTATYEAILYYKPEELAPTPTWQFMTYMDHAPKFWADANGNRSSVVTANGLTVTVTNTDLGDAVYQGQTGYKAIKSVMTISNVPASMYNPETLTKYYFRCIGAATYTTVKDTYSMARVDKWGGLVIDYAIDLHHNGVVNYGNTNIINGTTVTDAAGIVQATTGRQSSVWTYPKLSIHVPAGHHINTAIVYFDSKVAHNANDYISYNASALKSLGITVQEADANKLVLISTTKNKVELNTWQTALRNYVSFTTYDNADFTASKVAAGTTGGAKIRWVVDELRLAGVRVDPNTGKAFKVVNAGKIISWDEAFSLARAYDPDIGTNGRLAEITNASENNLIYNLKGGNNGVRVWLGANSTRGRWQWKTSGAGVSYTPGGISGDGSYLVQNSNGSWSGLKASYDTSRNVTMTNIGCGWNYGDSITLGRVTSRTFTKTAGHKYYVLAAFGDYGDSNGGGPISCDDPYFYANCNWDGSWDTWLTGIDGIYTASRSGTATVEMWTDRCGTPLYNNGYQGGGAALWYMNVYDLTAAFGAGKEPSAAQCSEWFRGSTNVYDIGYIPSKTVKVGEQVITDVRYYAVEYDLPSLAFAVTDHSAEDETYIGTNAKYTPQPGDKTVTAIISGNSKVYDGTQISPSAFTVYGGEGASESLFNITYTVTQGSYASYSPQIVDGDQWRETGAINTARYHAVATLTDAAIKAGWKLSDDSVLECDLIIYQRPINVYSYHNNRVYDQTSAGIINNIQPEARSGDSGIIPGDTVRFNTTAVYGSYVDKDGKATIHNSDTNNGGSEYTMYRNAKLSDLFIVHSEDSDPHHNYRLGAETYTGAINKRPVVVHSLYLDDPENPRNVKTYDSTNQATITDILIDNVLPGDEIGLKQQTMTGTYATAQAGETLTADGKTQKDRLKKLQENVITASTNAELTGNDYGDYFIEKESYSGAICREVLEVRIKNQVKLYGEADIETPWHINAFDSNSTSNPDGWLSITGLKGADKIELNDSFFRLGAFAPDGSTIAFGPQTPVGRYPVTETGITETNLPVLKNYIVAVYDGQLEIEPREVVVTASDGDWYEKAEGVPEVHATFEVQNDDRETYRMVGTDDVDNYADMLLMNGDTVEKFIRATDGTAPEAVSITGQLRKTLTSEAREYEEDGAKATILHNGSNIWYDTPWYLYAPARYLDIEAEHTLYPCEWCEQYHGFAMGTDHWHITGYEMKVNQDAEKGDVLTVSTVENLLGETVQNYKLRFVSGTLRVHPKLRFQLKATVPMYVCMYAYNGDGEVVEPTEYGITNYSNGSIRVTDINVDSTGGGFLITDKAPLDLLRGEMSMNMFGTQLVPGANTPANPERWIAAADASGGVDGVFLHLPLECYIASGNVNDETVCTPVTKVQYTIAEYGKTVPEVDDAELPEYIHGEPVTPSTTD